MKYLVYVYFILITLSLNLLSILPRGEYCATTTISRPFFAIPTPNFCEFFQTICVKCPVPLTYLG